VTFRESDGLTASSKIRFTVYDVREKLSKTAVVLGCAEIALGVIQDTFRLRLNIVLPAYYNILITFYSFSFRIPLRNTTSSGSKFQENGFITISTYCPEIPKPRSPAKQAPVKSFSHRRSQSLPPKLGIKLFVPPQNKLKLLFSNPNVSYSCTFFQTETLRVFLQTVHFAYFDKHRYMPTVLTQIVSFVFSNPAKIFNFQSRT
jgi:inositol polyphosphate-4-phosphatase